MTEYEIYQGALTVVVEAENNEEAVKLAIKHGLIKPNLATRVKALIGRDITGSFDVAVAAPTGLNAEAD